MGDEFFNFQYIKIVEKMIQLSIANDFSKTPGVRYPQEGEFSGEEFRDKVLIPKIDEAIKRGVQIEVDLDGTYGLGPSFLEEAFGGLIRKGFDYGQLMSILKFKSIEVPYYIDDIKKYLKEANENK